MENAYQGQPQLQFKPLPIIFAVIQIIVISVVALSITNLTKADEIINTPEQGFVAKITNISDAIPEEYSGWADIIEWSLLNTIIENSENYSVPKDATISSIRNGSIKTVHFIDYATHYVRMIVDVPELAESYEVFLEYPSNKDAAGIAEPNNPDVAKPYSILCVEPADAIYPDSNCKNSSSYSTRNMIVRNTLGYFDFNGFDVSFSDDGSSTINISPSSSSVNNASTYIQETKNAVSSLGISPELFTYRIIDNSAGT